VASCLNDACRHVALIDVWSYPAETEIPYFRSHVVCAKCGSRGNKIDVRPNWKEQPPRPSLGGQKWRVTMILRIIAVLLLGTLPASARVQRNVEQICAGTVAKHNTPGWYEIGSMCVLEPGKSSNTILAVCREGDTCIIHAIGTLEQSFHIERVISVDKLCTAADGTGKTFLCLRPLDGAKPR
jgi:hypothetical protein